MRLLQCDEDDSFRLTEDLPEDNLPPYAILSHRWLETSEEVDFETLSRGLGQGKLGYQKLKFCAEQARRDGLQYFWVDTCCINKANKAELSRSINSMFRWYQSAKLCYVYLSDVASHVGNDEGMDGLRQSTWFTRGWTLQELLAPGSVVFFAKDGTRLGDKRSLEQQIHEITAIPLAALRGTPLHRFSVDERLTWMTVRDTTLAEDKAYSLAGMFDVRIAPVYGEGFAQAHERLRENIRKRNDCVKDLRLSNPRDDKQRIEHTKGGLLVDAYVWILQHHQYLQWHTDEERRMLWIKGDPGKGKTMLLCGIIDDLQEQLTDPNTLLSYFFCQASDPSLNSATAVLRGLMLLLVDQQPSLAAHIQGEYDRSDKTLFEDKNAWFVLCEILTKMLQDTSFRRAYLIIDALDECVEEVGRLLAFIGQATSILPKVKWLVSSRNWPSIREQIADVEGHDEVSLELNAETVSKAVRAFTKHKVLKLSKQKGYGEDLRSKVLRHLYTNAKDTFLWVALSCQYLSSLPVWATISRLDKLPPGLDDFYMQMWKHICADENAGLYKELLSTAAIVYRPITLEELTCVTGSLSRYSNDLTAVIDMIERCGSFLTIREGIVYFVHESAKDFLFQSVNEDLHPFGRAPVHYGIFSRSLQGLSATLKRDIYNLSAPDSSIEDAQRPDPDPLAELRYSIVYWIAHLCAGYVGSLDDPGSGVHSSVHSVCEFLQGKFLYWLEALSLCRGMSEGVVLMAKLQELVEVISKACQSVSRDTDVSRQRLVHRHYRNSYETHFVLPCITNTWWRLTHCSCTYPHCC